jgi:quercetin dioxygenase-like cupin family protein
MVDMIVPQVVRRVVTGHNAQGRSKVLIDAPATNLKQPVPGIASTMVWCTDDASAEMPVGEKVEDMGNRMMGTLPPERGTRFAIMEFAPGAVSAMHRTESIDYIIMQSGEIEMDLDEGVVRLKAPDVLVQRGTVHAWRNPGREAARFAVILIDGKPLGIGNPIPRGGQAK